MIQILTLAVTLFACMIQFHVEIYKNLLYEARSIWIRSISTYWSFMIQVYLKELVKSWIGDLCRGSCGYVVLYIEFRRCVFVLQVTESTNFDELAQKEPWLTSCKLVVKPDMLFGKRGKSGLVALNLDLAQAATFVKECLGKEVYFCWNHSFHNVFPFQLRLFRLFCQLYMTLKH